MSASGPETARLRGRQAYTVPSHATTGHIQNLTPDSPESLDGEPGACASGVLPLDSTEANHCYRGRHTLTAQRCDYGSYLCHSSPISAGSSKTSYWIWLPLGTTEKLQKHCCPSSTFL